MAYSGSSIVDYLGSMGQDSSYAARAKLAAEKGIAGYAGTAEQNMQLLNTLRGTSPVPTAPPAIPKQEDYGDLGTLTVVPKKGTGNIPAVQNTMSALTGTQMPGAPVYPTEEPKTPRQSMLDAFDSFHSGLSDIESRITSAATQTEEEKQLALDLAKKRAQLNTFDRQALGNIENLYGQGRGETMGTLARKETKERRTSALERLGLAQEVDTISGLLNLAKDDRKNLGDVAMAQYNIASKKLDIALGIQKELMRMDESERDNARQYLLDAVSFAGGRNFDQLDAESQKAILEATANSPITLGMVKTALASAAEKAAASKRGELRSVDGLGVVQVFDDGSYKVVVPESPGDYNPDVPSFEEYADKQGLNLMSMTDEMRKGFVDQLRKEYTAKYGTGTVNLGKLTSTEKNLLTRGGLTTASPDAKVYFLSTAPSFQDEWARNYTSGAVKDTDLDTLHAAYTKWVAENDKSGAARDWSKLIPQE